MTVCALNGLFAIQFSLAEVALPLWIVTHTAAPAVTVSVLFAINTILVTGLQLPLSRGSDDVPRAGRMFLSAGLLMIGACAVLGLTGYVGPVLAVAALVAAELALTLAEIWSSAAGWGLSYELQPPERPGAYQGLFAMGTAAGQMLGPTIVTHTALDHGLPGWLTLGLMFALTGAAVRSVTTQHNTTEGT